jgi:hypothetical protein
MPGVRNMNKRRKWGTWRGCAMQLASTRDLLAAYISLWGLGRRNDPKQLSLFGTFVDSMTDGITKIAVLVALGITDVIPAWVFLPVVVLTVTQLSYALVYVVRRIERPKSPSGDFMKDYKAF